MKLKILGIQPGTFQKDDTYETYMKKQCDCMRKYCKEHKPYIAMFPELMTGPFFAGVQDDCWFETAEYLHGRTTEMMLDLAKELKIHLVYSFFEKAEEHGATHYYNTLGLISPTRGLIGVYRKNHIPWCVTDSLVSYEKYYFKPGNGFPVFKLDNGVTFAMLLCYDRSFPETWRSYYLQGAELIFMAACTWGFRYDFYVDEMRTRAHETHTHVICLNRAGEETVENEPVVRNHFGKGVIIAPNGEVIEEIGNEPWTCVTAEIDLEMNKQIDAMCPWGRDRRPEIYGILTANGVNFNRPFVDITLSPIKE